MNVDVLAVGAHPDDVELGIGDRLTAGLQAAQARLKAFGEGATKWGTRILAAGRRSQQQGGTQVAVQG